MNQEQNLKSEAGTFGIVSDSIAKQIEQINRQRTEWERRASGVSRYELEAKKLYDETSSLEAKLRSEAQDYQKKMDSSIEGQMIEAQKYGEEYASQASRLASRARTDALLNTVATTLIAQPFIGALGSHMLNSGKLAWQGGKLAQLGGTIASNSKLLSLGLGTFSGKNVIDSSNKFLKTPLADLGISSSKNVNLPSIFGNDRTFGGIDHTPISSGGLGGTPKVNISELGNLKQSLEHFGMPTLPKLHDLPKLGEALGRIGKPEDLANLTLGLPVMTSKSGKQMNVSVLYNPLYLKKMKYASKGQKLSKNQLGKINERLS